MSSDLTTRAANAFERIGYSVSILRGADAAQSAAKATEAVGSGIDVLAVLGGDGLVHLALQALIGTSTTLAIVPVGTGNDAARALGLPRGADVHNAVRVVAAGAVRELDAARVTVDLCGPATCSESGLRAESAYFLTVMASGFDSAVSERAGRLQWLSGQARYSLAALAELRHFRPLTYLLELDGNRIEVEAMLVAVGNTESYGGGLKICAGAVPDDGWLDVVVIAPMSRRELVRLYPQLFEGTQVSHPAYRRHRVRNATLASLGVVAYADGERLGPLPVTVDVAPGAVKVLVAAT